MTKGLLLILTGVTSAAGKDSVMKALLQMFPQMERIVTANTRPIRPGEIEGVDHYFKTKQQFSLMRKRGDFIEWIEFAGNFYGTPKSELEKVLQGKLAVWRIDPTMALKVQQALEDLFGKNNGREIWQGSLTVFIDVPDKQTLKNRMVKRGANPMEIESRLDEVWKERNKLIDQFDHVVVNKDGKLTETINQVAKLIEDRLRKNQVN